MFYDIVGSKKKKKKLVLRLQKKKGKEGPELFSATKCMCQAFICKKHTKISCSKGKRGICGSNYLSGVNAVSNSHKLRVKTTESHLQTLTAKKLYGVFFV